MKYKVMCPVLTKKIILLSIIRDLQTSLGKLICPWSIELALIYKKIGVYLLYIYLKNI